MLTKKLPCPSCGVGLKIADTLAAGARVKCPKCGVGFAVPEDNGQASNRDVDPPSPAVIVRKRRAAPVPEPAEDEYGAEDVENEPEESPRVRVRRRPAPPVDDFEDEEEDYEERPARRKRRKKRKKSSNNAVLVVSLVVVGVLLIGGGVTGAILLWPTNKKDEVATKPTRPGRFSQGFPGAGGPGASAKPGPSDSSKSSESGSGDSGEVTMANGQRIFEQNCTRCHRSGGAESGGRGGIRGPDLSTIGRDHDENWFVEFVRNPQSKKPDSRMPKFEGKLSEDQLRSVAKYLASLK